MQSKNISQTDKLDHFPSRGTNKELLKPPSSFVEKMTKNVRFLTIKQPPQGASNSKTIQFAARV